VKFLFQCVLKTIKKYQFPEAKEYTLARDLIQGTRNSARSEMETRRTIGRTEERSYESMDGRKGKRVENGNRRKVRISQRLEDKPEIGIYHILRLNIRI
jgi:hypothetical protein